MSENTEKLSISWSRLLFGNWMPSAAEIKLVNANHNAWHGFVYRKARKVAGWFFVIAIVLSALGLDIHPLLSIPAVYMFGFVGRLYFSISTHMTKSFTSVKWKPFVFSMTSYVLMLAVIIYLIGYVSVRLIQ